MRSPKQLLTFLVIIFFTNFVFSQNCENSDFEYGNFTNWNAYTGYCCGALINTPGVVSGRHTIITQSTLDPNTNNMISTMPPVGAGAYSIQLGNDNVGSEAERIRRSFIVSPDNQLFIYQYALVLQDPEGHAPIDKPKFEVRIFDENNDIIDPEECGYYQVTAGPETDTWGQNGEVRYKDWSTVGVDLSAYLGTTITVEFTVQDCGLGGHYGYAYIDAACGFLEIKVIGFCEGSSSVTLIAPDGFDSYYWPHSGETTQTVVIPVPDEGDSVFVSVTNQSGCETSILHIFEELPIISTTAGDDSLICVGQSVDIWADGGGVGGNYSWSVDGTEFSTDQVLSVSPTETTTYQVIASNANGCYSPDSLATVTITVDTTLYFELADDMTICIGESENLNGPSLNPVSYLWSTEFVDTLSQSQNITVFPTNSTTYTLQVSNAVCSYIDSIIIDVANAETLEDTTFIEFCPGDLSVPISGPDGYLNYSWSNGMNGQTITINPITEPTVQLNLTSVEGCEDSVVYVQQEAIYPVPTIATLNDTLCIGGGTTLIATSSGESYLWTSIPAGANSTDDYIVINPTETTTYIVQAFSEAGCSNAGSYDTMTIFVDNSVYFELGDALTICEGQTDTLVAPFGMDTYEWYLGGSVISNDSIYVVDDAFSQVYYLTVQSGNCSYTDYVYTNIIPINNISNPALVCVTESTIDIDAPNGYNSFFWPLNNSISSSINIPVVNNQIVQLQAVNNYGCTDTIDYTVTVIQPSILGTFTDLTICPGNQVTFTSVGTEPYNVFTWTSNPAGLNYQGSSLSVSPTTTTSYTVILTNQYNCVAEPNTETVTVNVNETQIPDDIAPVIGCLNDQVNVQATGASGQYSWNYNGQTSNTDNINIILGPNANLNLQITDNGCLFTTNIPITVNVPMDLTIISSQSQICASDTAQLTFTPLIYNEIEWTANGSSLGSNEIITVQPSNTTTYTLSYEDINGCESSTDYIQTVIPNPVFSLGPDLFVCDASTSQIGISNPGMGAQYLWNTNETTPMITVSTSGTYTLYVEELGCSFEDDIKIIFADQSYIGHIPNVFSPNNDGINDLFEIQNENLLEFQLFIVNRWGNKIFETSDPKDFWNGKSNGEDLADGVYFYTITYKLACLEKSGELTGFVTIVR